MSAAHTEGLLVAVDINGDGCMGLISGERDSILTVDETNFAYVYNSEDARRLVACWNACEGLTTDNLESVAMMGDTLFARFNEFNAEVVRQDKAIDAARTLLADALETFDDNPHGDHEVADRIRAFLKGGA